MHSPRVVRVGRVGSGRARPSRIRHRAIVRPRCLTRTRASLRNCRKSRPHSRSRPRKNSSRRPVGGGWSRGSSGRRRCSTWEGSAFSSSRRSPGMRCSRCAPCPAAARQGRRVPWGPSLSPQHLAWLMGLPERQVVPAGIEFAARPDAVFGPGETLLLRISLRAPARVAVLEEAAGGPGTQAWPGLSQAPALVSPPSSGGPAIQTVSLETPALRGDAPAAAGGRPCRPRPWRALPRRPSGGGGPAHDRRPALPGEPAIADEPPIFLNPGATPCVKGCEAEERP